MNKICPQERIEIEIPKDGKVPPRYPCPTCKRRLKLQSKNFAHEAHYYIPGGHKRKKWWKASSI